MNRELLIDLPDSQSTADRLEWARPLALAPASAKVVERGRKARAAAIAGVSTAADAARRRSAARIQARDVLPRHHFSEQLEREKRRTDRSKAPLSIALFDLGGRTAGDHIAMARLVDIVCANKRETDFLGCLTGETVAVLLPDTDGEGTACFTRKIVGCAGDLALSTIEQTYPDHLFRTLGGEHNDEPPVSFDDPASRKGGYILKRCIDFIGAVTLILLLSPLMLVTAAAIALSSPGPIIYKQIRLGRGGKPFNFYKFRSMRHDVDDRIHREYVTGLIAASKQADRNSAGPRPWCKLESDPRITPVGRVIRKTSIDELPQLLNVVKGDLSLVGPRPPLPYEASAYESWHLRRIFEVQPGITGLWQVEGGHATFDEMVRMDLRYLRTWSLMLDLKLLIKTASTVLRRNGAG